MTLDVARALINGSVADRLPITDRGLMYGDGLFETIAVRDRRPCLWRAHLERLQEGARRLSIPVPAQDLLQEECLRLIGDDDTCVVKILLTRGSGGRGYRPPADPTPTRILIRYPWPDYSPAWHHEGVIARWCRTPLGENRFLACIKHLNRLEQVLARNEWNDPAVAEGLMCDGRGRCIGGTMSNLFLIHGKRLLTPRLDTCGIAGTVRGVVLRLAGSYGLEAAEEDIFPAELSGADGLLLTNSLVGVWPVRKLGTQALDPGRIPTEFIDQVCRAAFTPD